MLKKILAILLAMMSMFLFAACGQTDNSGNSGDNSADSGKQPVVAPDYSDSDLVMPTYGYTPPPLRNGIDYRTEERYKEYRDAGLNILLLQADDGYDGEAWESSELKKKMNMAESAGNNKIIMFDQRLWRLCGYYDIGLVGSDKQFATTGQLDDYVRNCVKDYSKHSAFYGIQLRDEPDIHKLKCMGDLYKSLKRVLPDAFIQINLFPANSSNMSRNYYTMDTAGKTLADCYKEYLLKFLECSDADYIMFDSYPLAPSSIRADHFTTLQVVNEVAKEKGVSVYAVAQTCSYSSNGSKKTRICSEDDLYWQTNLYLGMGIKQISYFNYWRKKASDNEEFFDNASFINEAGEKTAIYGYMKNIHAEMQNLAKAILNFNYKGCKVVAPTPSDFSTSYLGGLVEADLAKISDLKAEANDAALITELYDEKNGNHMYMLQNILDPILDDDEEEPCNTDLTLTVTFKDLKAGKLIVYDKGNPTTVELDGGKYTITLKAGHAVYVIPY